MLWFTLALISAIFSATAAITQKKILFKETAISFATFVSITSLIIAIPFFFLIDFKTLTLAGICVLLFKSLLGATAFLFVMKGIKNLELSRALPLLVLTPGITAIFAIFILKETLSKFEILGILFLILGAYILSLKQDQNLIEPFKKIKGHYFIVAALLIFSITAILDKIILKNFKVPINAFMGFQHLFFAIIFISLFLILRENKKEKIKNPNFPLLIILTAIFTLTYRYTYIRAVSIAPIALVLSIKRISVLFAIIIGGRIFQEHNLFRKIISVTLLIIGALLIINT